jgi:putative transposase
MKSRPLGELVEKLGVSRSHSRPRVSNDNAFVESFFKTAKYSANYPKVFENQEEAKAWVRECMEGYNYEHRHSALGLLTPAQVHLGKTADIQEKHRQVLTEAK